jgi:uncharacterized protein YceK
MMKIRNRLAVLGLCAFTSCATVWTRVPQAAGSSAPFSHGLDHAAYRGVIFDATQIFRPEVIGYFCLIDLPLSLIGDTICLPYDLYEWSQRETKR